MLTATGLGFEKDVTLHFFVDKPRDKADAVVKFHGTKGARVQR